MPVEMPVSSLSAHVCRGLSELLGATAPNSGKAASSSELYYSFQQPPTLWVTKRGAQREALIKKSVGQ